MKILVLAGGLSPEREVSLSTGTMVCNALREKGQDVILVDLFYGVEELPGDMESFFADKTPLSPYVIESAVPDLSKLREESRNRPYGTIGKNVIELCKAADIVFMALHGEPGENGMVQAMLDMLDIKYTGAGYRGSAVAMDKALTKDIFMQAKVLTPYGFGIKKGEELPAINFPCVVKTSHGGSSVGVYFANDEKQLQDALKDAYTYEDEVVIEQFIKGREFTDVVIDGKAYPVVQIAPKEGFYEYKNKYQAGSTEEICPAPISKELTERIQSMAQAAYKALRLKVYARMDFIVDENEQIYCLEANTLPGMTPPSLIPQEAAAVGIGYEDLCQMLVELSLAKY